MCRLGFVVALLFAAPVYALPLPPTISGTFTGTWDGFDLGSGTVTFDLLSDRTDIPPHAGSDMEAVDWAITLTADNGRFSETGYLTNIWYWNCPNCADLDTMPWGSYWQDVSSMNRPVQDYDPPSTFTSMIPYLSGPDWVFATNENFLPTGMTTLIPGHQGTFTFDVPEPPTWLLLLVGLVMVASWGRGRKSLSR